MIAWNTASKKIESRYDGKVFEFAPNERKRILDQDTYNHLFFKLKIYGLVLMDELDANPEAEKKALRDGLKARWKTVDSVVRSFRTMNKDRESMKLSADSPSETVMDAAEEAASILEQLKDLDGELFKKVESYLSDERSKKIAAEIEENQPNVETKGAFETEIVKKRTGRPKKDVAALTSNP